MTLIKDVARRAAEELLAEHWDDRLPVDPIRISHALGMTVWLADLPDNESGRIVKVAGQKADIYLNKEEPAPRQAFTCAHELGHWVERKGNADDDYSFVDRRGDKASDPHEWFADHFAENLLMPTKRFLQAIDEGARMWDLEAKFGVSRWAAETRVRHLGLNPSDLG
jgi:Zn-dependent peptidase ImmA (M78 family)